MIRCRTSYSFRNAVGNLEDVAQILQDKGYSYAPITDRASTYGWVKWLKIAQKHGLKPILGVELAVSPDISSNRPIADHWTFLPIGESLEALNNLVGLATSQFRYQPLLSYEQALKSSSNLYAIMGNKTVLKRLNWQGEPFVQAALSPGVSLGYFNAITDAGIPWVAAFNNFFPNPEDRGLYQVVCGRLANDQTWPQWILSVDEWTAWVRDNLPKVKFIDILEQTEKILKTASQARPQQAKLPLPSIQDIHLMEFCQRGARERGIWPLSEPYRERMVRELTVIEQKKFGDYFFIVADAVKWAKERMIVGPARGSSSGSLVCYLLGITDIDPMPHNLIFERFIDINRGDLPDIDVDFSDQNREQVIQYLRDTYGKDRVARLGTVNNYGVRSALNESAKAMNVELGLVGPTAESAIQRAGGDARATDTLEDTFKEVPAGQILIKTHPEMKVACRIEGKPRHAGQHASAVVLNRGPLDMLAPTDRKTLSLMMDKEDAESLGLLKIDCLGLIQLSILEDALQMGKVSRNHLLTLKLDLKTPFDPLKKGQFTGIFQFQGNALRNLCRQFTLERFEDIVAVTALARPGPLATGNANEWVRRRNGKAKVTYPHVAFKPILENTLGIIVFQEQVMQIGREIGGLSWEQVTGLRKAISKSKGAEVLQQYKQPWIDGAQKFGISEEVLEKVWNDLCSFGSYAFNKSHAVAYSMISYWCCWMKSHMPLQFLAATLNHTNDLEKQREILRELVNEGYEYQPVDAHHSGKQWNIHGNKLIGPLSNIEGIGPKSQNDILASRRGRIKLKPNLQRKLDNPRTPLDSLWPIQDGIKRVCPDLKERNVATTPTLIKDVELREEPQTYVILGTPTRMYIRNNNDSERVAKRGYVLKNGEVVESLHFKFADDTDEIHCQIGYKLFAKLAPTIRKRGRLGKSLYALKGQVPDRTKDIRIMFINAVRYLGDLDE